MKGAASLFSCPMSLSWGPAVETKLRAWPHQFEGAGLFAIEASTGDVYVMVWDRELPESSAPVWMPLP